MSGPFCGDGYALMRCLVCDTEMRLAEVARDETLDVPGYEHRTYRCPSCGDEERRLTFNRDGEMPLIEPEAPPAEPTAAAPTGEPIDPASQGADSVALSADSSDSIDPHAGERPARIAPPALAQRLAKLVSTIKALPASASRLAKPTLRMLSPRAAPRGGEPVASLAARLAPELRAARPAPPSAALSAEPEQLPATGSAVPPPAPAPTAPPQSPPVATAADAAASAALDDFEENWKPLLLKVRQQHEARANSVANEAESTPAPPLNGATPLSAAVAVPAPPAAEPPVPIAPTIAPAQADLGFAEEEALLKNAIDDLRNPSPLRARARDVRPAPDREPPQPAVADREPARAADGDTVPTHAPSRDPERTEPAPTAPRAAPKKPADLEKRQLASRVVRIQQDPDGPRYLATDVTSGMTIMWHLDAAQLRAMCDRVGWQVVDN